MIGTENISVLRPWEPALGKPRQSVWIDVPTPEQISDPDDIFSLVWRTTQELLKSGLSKSSVRHYANEGLTVALRKHSRLGLEHYSESLVTEMVSEIRIRYEKGQAPRTSYQNLRKASFLLSEMRQTGKITLSPVPAWGQREPTEAFARMLRHFCDHANRTGVLAKGTVKTAKSAIRLFFFEMESFGFESFGGVTPADIGEGITSMAKRYAGGFHSAIFCIRVFLKHLHENGFTSEDLSLAVPETVARKTVFREGFTADEIRRLLETPNVETTIGKRDYAIMILAAQTGLRACDVVNLKHENIDWRAKEIRIMQQKTGKPLSLPLEPESGNAIADYLLNARPKSNLPYIFLCNVGVSRPIDNRSASAIVTKYLKQAKIVSPIRRRGFHSFRRSFGTRLLRSETPLELLRQLLGHSRTDSAKPYLSVDEQGLKSCALGLSINEKAGDLA
jgi:site-specific recombinase XerD